VHSRFAFFFLGTVTHTHLPGLREVLGSRVAFGAGPSQLRGQNRGSFQLRVVTACAITGQDAMARPEIEAATNFATT